jgi:hypothetical protein
LSGGKVGLTEFTLKTAGGSSAGMLSPQLQFALLPAGSPDQPGQRRGQVSTRCNLTIERIENTPERTQPDRNRHALPTGSL